MCMSRYTIAVASLSGSLLLTPEPGIAQRATAPDSVQHTAWDVPWQGRPRDPYVAPDGDRIWFVGQAGNYVAFFTPADGRFRQIAIDSGTHPHTVVVDKQGNAWYAGNMNGMIGRIDGRTLAISRYPMPDAAARDPHTIDFDARGNLWFSLQNSNKMGMLDVASGQVTLIDMPTSRSRPYGVIVAPDGTVWFDLFGTNKIGANATNAVRHMTYDPKTRSLWYGSDQGQLGRAVVPRTLPVIQD